MAIYRIQCIETVRTMSAAYVEASSEEEAMNLASNGVEFEVVAEDVVDSSDYTVELTEGTKLGLVWRTRPHLFTPS